MPDERPNSRFTSNGAVGDIEEEFKKRRFISSFVVIPPTLFFLGGCCLSKLILCDVVGNLELKYNSSNLSRP